MSERISRNGIDLVSVGSMATMPTLEPVSSGIPKGRGYCRIIVPAPIVKGTHGLVKSDEYTCTVADSPPYIPITSPLYSTASIEWAKEKCEELAKTNPNILLESLTYSLSSRGFVLRMSSGRRAVNPSHNIKSSYRHNQNHSLSWIIKTTNAEASENGIEYSRLTEYLGELGCMSFSEKDYDVILKNRPEIKTGIGAFAVAVVDEIGWMRLDQVNSILTGDR